MCIRFFGEIESKSSPLSLSKVFGLDDLLETVADVSKNK